MNADGNYLDFGNFGYDTRVAMRRNQEPLRAKYPYLSGYSAFGSNPIMYSDLDGNDLKIAFRKAGTYGFFDPGHIAIAIVKDDNTSKTGYSIINGWSFTPKENGLSSVLSLGGVASRQSSLVSDIKDATEIIDLKTNQQFDKILSDEIDKRKLVHEKYDLDDNNCGLTATDLLNTSLSIYGVKLQFEKFKYPSETKDELKSNKIDIEKQIQQINNNLNPVDKNIDKIKETTKETAKEGSK